MRGIRMLAVAALVMWGVESTASAFHRRGIVISGGGEVKNFNSVNPYGTLELTTRFHINARSGSKGEPVEFDPFGVMAVAYPAAGRVSLRNVTVDTGTVVSALRGRVVCVADLGPSEEVDGDDPNDNTEADPQTHVWEIRFRIQRAILEGEQLELPDFPVYGSIFIQDGPSGDFLDENFEEMNLDSPDCANNPFFGLEPLIKGAIQVRARGALFRYRCFARLVRRHHHRHRFTFRGGLNFQGQRSTLASTLRALAREND